MVFFIIRLHIKTICDAANTAKHEAMYTDRIAISVSNSVHLSHSTNKSLWTFLKGNKVNNRPHYSTST